VAGGAEKRTTEDTENTDKRRVTAEDAEGSAKDAEKIMDRQRWFLIREQPG
jgi:hypothetical protein